MSRKVFKKFKLFFFSFLLATVAIYGVATFVGSDNEETKTAKAADLADADIPNLIVVCNTVKISAGTTACVFDLMAADATLPTNFKIGIGDATTVNAATAGCTVLDQRVTCISVPLGSDAGIKNVYAHVTSPTGIATGEKAYIMGEEPVGQAQFYFSPDQGGVAPYFNDVDDITITVKDLKTDLDLVPQDDEYTCSIETRLATEWTDTNINWEPLPAVGGDSNYKAATGCSAILTKAKRGTDLNWSLRAVMTNVADPSKVYYTYDNYIFKIAGTGAIF